MSKPRYGWWSYAKDMIRRYPELSEEYADLHTMKITPKYSDEPRGTGLRRPLEDVAVRELPTNKQREYEAVRRAIETTEEYANGEERMAVVKLVLWSGSHTLEGAAVKLFRSMRTVAQWHGEFIRLVASYYGLMD